jgi:hypothetical protein
MLGVQSARRWALAAVILQAIALAASPGRAADGSDLRQAEKLIKEGNVLRRNHQDAQALPLYQQAYDLARTPRSAAQLGLAEAALGYWDAANDHLTEALTSSRNPWVEENRAVLEKSQKEARSHLASLTVEGGPPGAEVVLNKKTLGTLPLDGPVLVIEGRAELEVRAAGFKTDHRNLTLVGGAPSQITVRLQAVAPTVTSKPPTVDQPPATPAPAGPTEPLPGATPTSKEGGDTAPPAAELPAWRRVLPWVLAGGAAVAVGLGVWQQLSAKDALNQFDAIAVCGSADTMRGSAQCSGLYNDWSSRRTRAFIGYGVAGALGAAAVGMIIWNAESSPAEVQVGMGFGRIVLRGTF